VPEGLEGRTVWVGRDGFVEFMRTWTEQFEGWSLQVERLIDADDDRAGALTRQSATGKESGVPVELNLGMVYELKAGRVIRVRAYLTHAEAIEAAGLSE
jgi:ketosteroid isomerase-like protein